MVHKFDRDLDGLIIIAREDICLQTIFLLFKFPGNETKELFSWQINNNS